MYESKGFVAVFSQSGRRIDSLVLWGGFETLNRRAIFNYLIASLDKQATFQLHTQSPNRFAKLLVSLEYGPDGTKEWQ